MAPIPYAAGEGGSTIGDTGAAFRCPTCDGTLRRTQGTWSCGTCGFVPRHGAD